MDDILKVEYLRYEAVNYIKRWVGTPYIWSGNDFSGFDCNGLAHEYLQSVGIEKNGYDCTAHQIYLNLKEGRSTNGVPYTGCLVFWFKPSGKVNHVAILINNYQVIEAAGGGSETKTIKDAIRDNAYVRIRPLNYRGGNYKIIDPVKNWNPDEEN